jgi:hypothetical protein
MQLRNIPRNIPIRTRRVLNWRKNNAPFLSGDFFADFCDVSLYEPAFRFPVPTKREIENARSIFCPSHKYELFIDEYGRNLSAKVLILGNSDRDFDGPLTNLPSNFKTVYRQNSIFNNHTYKLLPIGLENVRLGQNGRKFLFKSEFVNNVKFKNLMIGPFSPTHTDRSFLLSLEESSAGPWDVFKGRIKPRDFAGLSSNYRAIAAPRGNGLDTHRFWEALYRGSYPIVVKTTWSDHLETLGIPLIAISDWNFNELERVSNLVLNPFNPQDFAILWTPFWESEILNQY